MTISNRYILKKKKKGLCLTTETNDRKKFTKVDTI